VNVHRPLVSRRVGVSRTDVSALEVFELGGDVQTIRRGRHDVTDGEVLSRGVLAARSSACVDQKSILGLLHDAFLEMFNFTSRGANLF